MRDQPLVGRERERAVLALALARTRGGKGQLLLLGGEAGAGKTHLVEEALAQSGLLVLYGGATQWTSPAYAPIVAALRYALRQVPTWPDRCGPLARHLALLLPELGPAPADSDRATLFEALRLALVVVARDQPAALFLDDLHWADSTTLEFLPALAGWIEREPLLVVGTYRNDEIPRGHPLRRLRTDLRRAGRLNEIAVEPLTRGETATLAARLLGEVPSPALAATLYDRTQGVPFFIEELISALVTGARLRHSAAGLELAADAEVPIPESVRDAVLLRAEGISDTARQAIEIAAVVGLRFDVDMVATLSGGHEGLIESIERGLVVEVGPSVSAFRHALTREALYGDIPWLRRRAHHRKVAELLEARGGAPASVAEHWLAAREFERGRHALLAAAEAACQVHAYRDAARAARQALELWPENEDEANRLAVLDRLGQCAELCGDLPEAVQAWQEVAAAYRQAGELRQLAAVERRLATAYELQGAWERALAARQAAAAAFDSCAEPGEAAAERIAMADFLEHASRFGAALELATMAVAQSTQAGRLDLKAQALGLTGQLRADLGQIEEGLHDIRSGLSLALDHGFTGPAAEIYYRLATALDQASDYGAAQEAYVTAIAYCQQHSVSSVEHVCVACLAFILRQTGEWDRASNLCREVLDASTAPPPASAVAAGMLGSIRALRGETASARGMLLEAHARAQQFDIVPLELDSAWGLAIADEFAGDDGSACARHRLVRDRWELSEDRHYAIGPLRWAATFFARRGAETDARASTDALAKIATATGNPEALAALAHALGECALLDGDAPLAVHHFSKALDLLRRLEAPLARTQTLARTGAALTAAGERQAAVERLTDAYHTARKLGARPLATRAAQELTSLGERIERRLGRRAVKYLERGDLTRRELEILRLVSLGRTNREIARELFLSPRTVEMYVGNLLAKLGCSRRAEAINKAHEMRLIATGQVDAGSSPSR
jgi:DNA-binding CsgD family transcriptional regulator